MDDLEKFVQWMALVFQVQQPDLLQQLAQQLGEEGMKVMAQVYLQYPDPEQARPVVQQMLQQGQQGAQMARQGAVLNAYRNTMGFCAPDEQLVFFKRGGRICKTCQKKVVEAKRGAKAKAKFFKNGKRLNKNC